MANEHNNNTKNIQGWNVKNPVTHDDLAPQSRVDLDPKAFDDLIKQKGVRLKVFRSLYCPNVKSIDGGEHNVDCDMCNGSGYLDVRPIKTLGFIANQSLDKERDVAGDVDGNSVMITLPTGIEMQYFTLIELLDFTDIYYQRVVRSTTNIDNLKYFGQRVNVIVDSNGIEYFPQTDFCLFQGNIKWATGKGPAQDVIYSIHYEANVQFRAVKAIHVNRFSQVKSPEGILHLKFPENWLCVKEFLIRRKDINGADILPNPIPGYEDEFIDP